MIVMDEHIIKNFRADTKNKIVYEFCYTKVLGLIEIKEIIKNGICIEKHQVIKKVEIENFSLDDYKELIDKCNSYSYYMTDNNSFMISIYCNND